MNTCLPLRFLVVLSVLCLLGFWSCTEEMNDLATSPDLVAETRAAAPAEEPVYDEASGSWVCHRNDPYTLANFRQAYDNLMQRRSARSMTDAQAEVLSSVQLAATHYSVKIYPKTEEQERILERDTTLSILYIPFDYVQLPESETEHLSRSAVQTLPAEESRRHSVVYDTESVEGIRKTETIVLPILYAVWPCSKPFPADLDYEILYEVYLPEMGSSGSSTRSLAPNDDAMRLLVQEAVELALGPQPEERIVGLPPIYVAGSRISVHDISLFKSVPLENMRISIRSGSFVRSLYTDANGYANFEPLIGILSSNSPVTCTFQTFEWTITTPGGTAPIVKSLGTYEQWKRNGVGLKLAVSF